MEAFKEFERYIAHLSEGLGHADRHAGLKGYCTGLMLPLGRKSVEPMAAGIDPLHVSARHQGAASLRGQVRVAGRGRAGAGARLGGALAWPGGRMLLDHRRHGLSQEGTPLGGRGAPVLRPVGWAFCSKRKAYAHHLQIGIALPHQLMTWRRILGATEVAAQARYQSHGLPGQDRLSEAFF